MDEEEGHKKGGKERDRKNEERMEKGSGRGRKGVGNNMAMRKRKKTT
jgi:hypothetical protein